MKYVSKKIVYSAIAALVVLAKPIGAMDQKPVLEQKSQNLGSSHAFTEEGKLKELIEICRKTNQLILRSEIKVALASWKTYKLENAIEHLKIAEAREPKNEIVHFSLALCYSGQKDHTNAIKHCLLSDQSDPFLQFKLASSYFMLGRREEAIAHYLKSDQNNQAIQLLLGSCYIQQRNPAEAMKFMQNASSMGNPEQQRIFKASLNPLISDLSQMTDQKFPLQQNKPNQKNREQESQVLASEDLTELFINRIRNVCDTPEIKETQARYEEASQYSEFQFALAETYKEDGRVTKAKECFERATESEAQANALRRKLDFLCHQGLQQHHQQQNNLKATKVMLQKEVKKNAPEEGFTQFNPNISSADKQASLQQKQSPNLLFVLLKDVLEPDLQSSMEKELKDLIKKAENGNIKIQCGLGSHSAQQGLFEEAEYWYGKASESGNQDAVKMLNDIQEEKIELKKEEEYLKEKKKFNELGNFYNDQCRFTEAKDSYKKAIALNADESSSGLFALGYLHLKLNELEEAKSCLTEGINRKELEHKRIKEDGGSIWVSPTHDPEYSLEFGEIYEKQGLLKEAEACYKKAINFDKGDDFDAPYVKGVKQVPIKDGDRGTNYILGVFYEKQNRLAEAENCYKEASQKFDDTYSSYRLGKLYEKQNKLTEAEACYKKAAKKEEPHLIFNLWAFYKKHGKSNEEKELVQQISSENGKDETSAFMKSLDERIKKGFSLEDCGPVLSLSLMEFYDISKM